MIRSGHVGIGFSEDEVEMAAGEPEKIEYGENGSYNWLYQRSNNKILIVQFNGSGTVEETTTRDGILNAPAPSKTSKITSKKRIPTKKGPNGIKNGTPIQK
jgi:hypothetical protein